MADTKYCYPHSDVLKNKLGITDEAFLSAAEREFTASAWIDVLKNPIKGNFDYSHLKAIHKGLFSSLYAWAGESRTVDIAKGLRFATAQYLDENARVVFDAIGKDNYLIGMPFDSVVKRLAEHMGNINVLHPFREGNGRTQRMFITYLAQASGYMLEFEKCSSDRMLEASKYSAAGYNERLEQIFRDIAVPLPLMEQQSFLQAVSPLALEVFLQHNKAAFAGYMTLDGVKSQIAEMKEPKAIDARQSPQRNSHNKDDR